MCLCVQQEQSQHRHAGEGPSARAEAPHRHSPSSAAHRGQGRHQTNRQVTLKHDAKTICPEWSFLQQECLKTAFPRVCGRRGQGSGAGDRHRVQPVGESPELLHGRVLAPPGPDPELRTSDWHVRHPPWHKWARFMFYAQASENGRLDGWIIDAEPSLYRAELSSLCCRSDPVSRKSIKSAHSSRNRYSSQWTLSRPSQSTASARTLTSDWRTMGSHGITATESDSYSASLSQDTGLSIWLLPFVRKM